MSRTIRVEQCVLDTDAPIVQSSEGWTRATFRSNDSQLVAGRFVAMGWHVHLNELFSYNLCGSYNATSNFMHLESLDESPRLVTRSFLNDLGKTLLRKSVISPTIHANKWLSLIDGWTMSTTKDNFFSSFVKPVLTKWSNLYSPLSYWLNPAAFRTLYKLCGQNRQVFNWPLVKAVRILSVAKSDCAYTLCFPDKTGDIPIGVSDLQDFRRKPFTDHENRIIQCARSIRPLDVIIPEDETNSDLLLLLSERGLLRRCGDAFVHAEVFGRLEELVTCGNFVSTYTDDDVNQFLQRTDAFVIAPSACLIDENKYSRQMAISFEPGHDEYAILEADRCTFRELLSLVRSVGDARRITLVGDPSAPGCKLGYNAYRICCPIGLEPSQSDVCDDVWEPLAFGDIVRENLCVTDDEWIRKELTEHASHSQTPDVYMHGDRVLLDSTRLTSINTISDTKWKSTGKRKRLSSTADSAKRPGSARKLLLANGEIIRWTKHSHTSLRRLTTCSTLDARGLRGTPGPAFTIIPCTPVRECSPLVPTCVELI